MRPEVESAAAFLSDLLRLQSVADHQLERFRVTVIDHLLANYESHWFPDTPVKGSAFRCLRINHNMDPMLSRAGRDCGWNDSALRQLLPNELTLWVDPNEVSYRIGENGSICVLYDTTHSSSSLSSSASSSPSQSPHWLYDRQSPPNASPTPTTGHQSAKKSFYLNPFLN